MRVGMVCPYSFDVPGGVQNHVLDLCQTLGGLGVDVSVLAPAADDDDLPDYVTPAGRAVPVRYNGAVARVSFGPMAMARTRRWLRDGRFDVLHVHDPATPSVSLVALSLSSGVSIATIHTSIGRSRALAATESLLRPAMEKLSARITVSREAHRVVEQYQGGDSVIIPNGLFVDDFAGVPRSAGTTGRTELLFLGRFEEARKGLPVLLDALPAVIDRFPDIRLVVAGAGDPRAGAAMVPERLRPNVEVVGRVSDAERANQELFATRWRHKITPDDYRYYWQDGLLSAQYGARYPIRLSVSPLLAGVTVGENDRLADRSREDRLSDSEAGRRPAPDRAGRQRVVADR